MSCEECASAYDTGFWAGTRAENARLKEQVEALEEVAKLARNGYHWVNSARQRVDSLHYLTECIEGLADKAVAALCPLEEVEDADAVA